MAGRNAQNNPTVLAARKRSRDLATLEKIKNKNKIDALQGEEKILHDIAILESNVEVLDYDLSKVSNMDNKFTLKKRKVCILKIEELKKELKNV
jgi:hypothetical protein